MIFAQDFQWVSNYRKRHVKHSHKKGHEIPLKPHKVLSEAKLNINSGFISPTVHIKP